MTVSSFLATDERERSDMIRRLEAVLDAHHDTRDADSLRLAHVTDALIYEPTVDR